jgi:hypothetical protein
MATTQQKGAPTSPFSLSEGVIATSDENQPLSKILADLEEISKALARTTVILESLTPTLKPEDNKPEQNQQQVQANSHLLRDSLTEGESQSTAPSIACRPVFPIPLI